MLESSAVLQFSFFIVFALLGTVLSVKLRQPYVVGLLLFGMIAGPNVLGLVKDAGLISTFSDLGAMLLLFSVGIEFSVSRIMKSGLRAVLITAFKMGTLFFFTYEAALYFGLDLTASLALGAMLSITSTAVMFKIVSEKGMAKNPTMPLLFSMLIVEDLVAVAALTFFSSLGTPSPTYEDKFVSVLFSLGLLGGFYLLVRRHLSDAIFRLTSSFSEETLIFVSFSLCLVMGTVAAYAGLSPAIGAFLAGSIISALPNSRRIARTINPLLLTFAALFFLSLGMQIDPATVASNLGMSLSLSALFVLACFASVFVALYVTGATTQNAIFGASSMVVLGEFSLLIASEYTGPYSQLLMAAGSLGVMATAIVSSFLLGRQQQLLSLESRAFPPWLRRAGAHLSDYFTGLLRDFSPRGAFWRVSSVCWECASRKLAAIAAIAAMEVASLFAIRFLGIAGPDAVRLRIGILWFGVLAVLYFLAGILWDLRPMFDTLSRTIARHKRDAKDENIILRDAAVALVLLVFSMNASELVAWLQLPPFFGLLDEFLFLLALLFGWNLIVHAGRLHNRRKKGQ